MMFNEEAKAVQEVAKTGQEGLKTAQMFGSFISRIIGGSLEQGIGIFEDKLKYMRLERAARLECSYRELQKELGLEKPDKAIPMKYAVPLFQAATLEDDDYLQNLWVNLLVKASHKEFDFDINRTYIDILERLSPLEAKVLLKIYSFPVDKIVRSGVLTVELPEKAICYSDVEVEGYEYELTNNSVLIALANLNRLDCLTPRAVFGGKQRFDVVYPTIMGEYFVKSCTINYDEKLN